MRDDIPQPPSLTRKAYAKGGIRSVHCFTFWGNCGSLLFSATTVTNKYHKEILTK